MRLRVKGMIREKTNRTEGLMRGALFKCLTESVRRIQPLSFGSYCYTLRQIYPSLQASAPKGVLQLDFSSFFGKKLSHFLTQNGQKQAPKRHLSHHLTQTYVPKTKQIET